MKKIKALALAICLALCGCGETVNETTVPEAYKEIEGDYPAFFEYAYKSSYSERFAVADDGRFVRTGTGGSGVSFIEHTMDGESRRIGFYSSIPEAMAFMGNELYILGMKWGSGGATGINLYKLNEESGQTELTDSFDMRIDSGCSMSGNADELYIRADEKTEGGSGGLFGDNSVVLRIHGGEIEKLPVDAPTAVCAKKTGGAIIAGRDDNGTYITQYIDGEFTERLYSDDMMIHNIADIDGEHIAYTTWGASDSVLCVSALDNLSTAELIPDMQVNGARLGAAGGYCFFEPMERTMAKDFAIYRVKISEYYKGNIPLDFIYTSVSGEAPFSNGYMINRMKLSGEEAALKILSQDKDYDICYISTEDAISHNLKSKGSFYPLNDITGVKEYLDKCFPAIKEAFTDENGDIWALPVVAETSFLFCERSGPDFSKMTVCEFADYIDGLSDEDNANASYGLYDIKQALLNFQAIKYGSFDTPEFREAAERLYRSERLNMYKRKTSGSTVIDGTKAFLRMIPANYVVKFYSEKEYYVYGMPGVESGNVLMPSITFMCVNPNSGRLDDVKEYIAKVAEYQLTSPDNFILTPENGVYSDNETVRRITELCSSETVCFTYPHELYWDDFDRYLNDELSLDDFIKEADRKLKAYLNE